MTSPDISPSSRSIRRSILPASDTQRQRRQRTIGALSLEDVKAWYASAYRPDLTTIVVIGDTTPENAKAVVEKYFGAWKAQGPKPNVNLPPVPQNVSNQTDVPATGRVQSSVRLVETLPIVANRPGVSVARACQHGLDRRLLFIVACTTICARYAVTSIDVQSNVAAGRTRSTFGIAYGCDPKNILPAQAQIATILAQLQSTPIEPDRLLRSKALLMGEVTDSGIELRRRHRRAAALRYARLTARSKRR